jgi:hypothetical protein
MNESHKPGHPSRGRKLIRVLAMIAFIYAIVAGGLLISLLIATALHEPAPLARVVGLGCYGVAGVGASLHLVVGLGLLRDAKWLGDLTRGTGAAIVIPLILAVLFFVVVPIATNLNHAAWSVVALIIGVPWPLYLNFAWGTRTR